MKHTRTRWVIVGASSALDTMGAQSWGAGDPAALHKWGGVCAATLLAMNVVAAAVLAAGEPIALHILHQTPETSAMVGQFCQLLIPGMPPLTIAIILHKMLQVSAPCRWHAFAHSVCSGVVMRRRRAHLHCCCTRWPAC
jgi:Na+-driven multidrug efflux pump